MEKRRFVTLKRGRIYVNTLPPFNQHEVRVNGIGVEVRKIKETIIK